MPVIAIVWKWKCFISGIGSYKQICHAHKKLNITRNPIRKWNSDIKMQHNAVNVASLSVVATANITRKPPDHHSVTYLRQLDYLCKSLFRITNDKTTIFVPVVLTVENLLGANRKPSQRTSNVEIVNGINEIYMVWSKNVWQICII